jgi:hypothetical protein
MRNHLLSAEQKQCQTHSSHALALAARHRRLNRSRSIRPFDLRRSVKDENLIAVWNASGEDYVGADLYTCMKLCVYLYKYKMLSAFGHASLMHVYIYIYIYIYVCVCVHNF